MKTKIVCGFLAVVAAVATGCQTYDFEPVRPLAVAQTTKPVKVVSKESKPNLFLVVDKSGSMNFSADPRPTCTTSCGSAACGGNGCRTRIAELKDSMKTFLTTSGSIGHMGMVPFPNTNTGPNQCGVDNTGGSSTFNESNVVGDITALGVELDVGGSDDDTTLANNALVINDKIQGINPSGGTPTGATLRGLKAYDPLLNKSRSNYVLLLTDGQPNCNQRLPASCPGSCTIGSADPCVASMLNQCLDKDGTTAEITELKSLGIKTIVIGFGAELASGTGQAVTTLTAMGAAGGFQRPCTSDTQCGSGDTCSVNSTDPCGRASRVCARTFFTAQNASELTTALNTIRDSIKCTDPCTQILSARPTADDERLVSVLVDGVNVTPSATTWHYDKAGPAVVFPQGTTICNNLLNATSQKPVNLEIRVVESL